MNGINKLAEEIVKASDDVQAGKTSPYDTKGTVRRIDGNIAHIHFDGGVDETPVDLTISAKVGDVVQVRVANGKAWIVGNNSAPPTDDTVANVADQKAGVAKKTADAADEKATDAKETAIIANDLAESTNAHFWHDETGAHVTEVTQDEYKQDPPNAKGNVLITPEGFAVRNGTLEFGSFTKNGIVLKGYEYSPSADYSDYSYLNVSKSSINFCRKMGADVYSYNSIDGSGFGTNIYSRKSFGSGEILKYHLSSRITDGKFIVSRDRTDYPNPNHRTYRETTSVGDGYVTIAGEDSEATDRLGPRIDLMSGEDGDGVFLTDQKTGEPLLNISCHSEDVDDDDWVSGTDISHQVRSDGNYDSTLYQALLDAGWSSDTDVYNSNENMLNVKGFEAKVINSLIGKLDGSDGANGRIGITLGQWKICWGTVSITPSSGTTSGSGTFSSPYYKDANAPSEADDLIFSSDPYIWVQLRGAWSGSNWATPHDLSRNTKTGKTTFKIRLYSSAQNSTARNIRWFAIGKA